MAITFRGLTLKLGVDTVDLDKGIRSAKQTMSGLPREIKKIESALKISPGNVKLLEAQQTSYRAAIKSTEEQLKLLKEAERQVAAGDVKMDDAQWAKLQGDIAKAEQALDGYRQALAESIVQQNLANSSFNQAGIKLEKFGEKIAPVGEKMDKVGSALTKTVTPAILAAGAASVAAAIEMDDSLTSVRKTVDGTEQQYMALKSAAVEFSKTNAVSASQILDIQALGAQLGYTIDELQLFGEVVSGLDIATNMSAEDAATELAQFANIMGMAHDKTKNYGSTIVALGNNFATTEADISHMAMRIAGAAKSIGLTEADVLGLSTALASMGIEAEAGGTAISTIMSSIDKAVAMNSDSLEAWASAANMSVGQFKAAWGQDAVGALSAVLVGMDSAVQSGGNMSKMLSDLGITSIRQTDTMKRLANNSEFLGRAVDTANQAWRENSALDAEVANRNNSLSAQFGMLKNRVTAIAESYGGPLCRAMLEVLDAAEPLINAIADGAEAFSDMSEDEQKAVLACVALSAAAGPLLKIFGTGVRNVSAIGKGMQSLAEFMARAKVAAVEQTAATKAQTAAANASATASKAQGAAAATSAAGTAAMGTASTGAAVGVGVLRTALMALPLVGILAGVTAVVAGLGAFASGAMEAMSSTKRLTTESQRQADEVARLKSEYESAAAAQGENSDAAVRAKDAYEQANASFEESRQTLGKLVDECRGAVDSHGQLVDSLRDAEGEAASQAGAILNLAGSVADLLEVENRSDDQKAKLASMSRMLNDALGREAVAYDEVADSCDLTGDAVRNLAKAEADRVRGEAAMKRYNSLMEDSVSIDAQLARAQEELEAETRRCKETYGELFGVQVWTSQAQFDLEQQVADLTAAQSENADEMERALKLAQDMAAHDQALAQAVEAVKSGQMTAAEAAQAYGEGLEQAVTETEVAVQATAELAEESDEASKKVQKISEALSEYCSGSKYFSDAIRNAGWTVDELAQHLSDTGQEASDLTKAFEDLSSKTCNAFDEIEQKQDVSLDKMLQTLEHNRKATENWSQNLAALYEGAASESERRFIDYIAGMGPEYAGVLEDLKNDTTGKLAQLSAEYDAAGAAAGDALVTRMHLARENAATEAQGASDAVSMAIQSMAEKVGAEADAVEADLEDMGVSLEDLGSLSDEQLSAIVSSYDGSVQSVRKTLQSFVTENKRAGSDGPAAMAGGISGGRQKVTAAASGVASAAALEFAKLAGAGQTTGIAGAAAFGTGVGSKASYAGGKAKTVGNAVQDKLESVKKSAPLWGQHTTENYAGGIANSSSKSTLMSALGKVGEWVKSVLGHTIAKEGPLHEGGEGEIRWGRHSVENYAEGMLEALPAIRMASEKAAEEQKRAMSAALGVSDMAANATVRAESLESVRQTVQVTRDPQSDRAVQELAFQVQQMRRELPRVISDNTAAEVVLDDRAIGRFVKKEVGR